MRQTAKVLKIGQKDGMLLVLLQINERQPEPGTIVSVQWGKKRTTNQNSLYWQFLTWCIEEGGLKRHGHFFPDALHENVKQHLVKESTSDMTTTEFNDYFEKVKMFMKEFFEVDVDSFFQGNGGEE